MQQTPVHDHHNPDLLRLIPPASQTLIEIGCSSGALAREFRLVNPASHYVGVDIDADYIEIARQHCHVTHALDIEHADDAFFQRYADRDCWIFGDTLEHMRDPWRVLQRIREVIPEHGSVVACIPNAQHWSMFAKLSIGDFRYEDSGLFDRTHLRWFTRETMIELFAHSGFSVVDGVGRLFDEPHRDRFLPLIGEIARACGVDPQTAINDATPVQYVLRAVPN